MSGPLKKALFLKSWRSLFSRKTIPHCLPGCFYSLVTKLVICKTFEGFATQITEQLCSNLILRDLEIKPGRDFFPVGEYSKVVSVYLQFDPFSLWWHINLLKSVSWEPVPVLPILNSKWSKFANTRTVQCTSLKNSGLFTRTLRLFVMVVLNWPPKYSNISLSLSLYLSASFY